jgi:SHAQKYF class myb-like DNA-binding protein
LLFFLPFESFVRRWTVDEHRLFLEGIMLYGKDWKKMQPLIKTRSLVQIRTHAQKVFKKIGLKKITGGIKRRGLSKDGDEGEVRV